MRTVRVSQLLSIFSSVISIPRCQVNPFIIWMFLASLPVLGCSNERDDLSQDTLHPRATPSSQDGDTSEGSSEDTSEDSSETKPAEKIELNPAQGETTSAQLQLQKHALSKVLNKVPEVSKAPKTPQEIKKPKKPKKPKKCRRGIHKGRRECTIKRGHISVHHINRGKRHQGLKIIDEKRRIIPEARAVMLELLGDWREKTQCKRGYSFNYEYKGRASWRMYKCNVQDRLLWYLYLIGHHFDSEILIVSGLRSKERKTSRHHNGHAVDFRVRGVSAKKVWEYCKKTFPLVGIGYYPKTHFVHLDVGRDHHQAYWVDSSGSGESASYKNGVSQHQRGRARKSQAGMIASIQRSLKRHYAKFKEKRARYQKRQKERERKRKIRAQKRKKRAKKRAQKRKKSKRKSKK